MPSNMIDAGVNSLSDCHSAARRHAGSGLNSRVSMARLSTAGRTCCSRLPRSGDRTKLRLEVASPSVGCAASRAFLIAALLIPLDDARARAGTGVGPRRSCRSSWSGMRLRSARRRPKYAPSWSRIAKVAPGHVLTALAASAWVERRGGGYAVELKTEHEGQRGQRALSAADCKTLVRTVTLVIALAFGEGRGGGRGGRGERNRSGTGAGATEPEHGTGLGHGQGHGQGHGLGIRAGLGTGIRAGRGLGLGIGVRTRNRILPSPRGPRSPSFSPSEPALNSASFLPRPSPPQRASSSSRRLLRSDCA